MVKTAPPPDESRTGRRTGLDRDDIVAAALDLVCREGPDALTMRGLAAHLDVGTPTIYWHVGSRDELVVAVIRLQSDRLAQTPIEGDTARERVFSAARHIWTSAIEHRATTSLAHRTGTSSLLAHPLEVALVMELEAAGLAGAEAGEATRSILIAVSGALVLALRDVAAIPPEHRPAALWRDADASIAPETLAALAATPDLDALCAATLHAVIDHYLPATSDQPR